MTSGKQVFRSIALRLAVVVTVGWLVIGLVVFAWIALAVDSERRAREFARGIRTGWSEEQVRAYVGSAPQEDSRVHGEHVRQTRKFVLGWKDDQGMLRVRFEGGKVSSVAPAGD